jgi:asparagine synthase (glutamine-hydrolysing)
MCGIVGFVEPAGGAYDRARIAGRMADCIRHRGPDDSGVHADDFAALGHRRLSIIDLSAGHQPMYNEDETLCIVYNGEVFNHADIRPELERAGHTYSSRCDTETILHAYEEYGPACVTHFRGMFSFAIWDSRNRTLFCARDRLGIKPFYYYWDGRLFAFASEIKALLQHPNISAAVDDSLLPEYFAFGYISEERTLFSGIRKLMPGHHLVLNALGPAPRLEIRQYWDNPAPEKQERRDDASWIGECRQRLEETVRMRLMSDVPLGMFLSGGVDSSAIAALMKRMVSTPVKTFAVGYQETEYSELSYARHVARTIGADHHDVVVGMDDFFNALPRLIWHEDEPITWPSSVSLYFVSRLAAEQVKVVLTGEGSDELFAGYSRYRFYELNRRWLNIYRVVPGPLRRLVRSHIRNDKSIPAGVRRKLGHTFLGAGETLEALYLDNFFSAFDEEAQQKLLLSPGAPGAPYRNFLRYWNEAANRGSRARMLYVDQKTYLVELLMKQDQMSMACSLESRVPFLDHPFVEFAARVPDRLKIRQGTGKYILKRAIEDLLPREIIYRRKMGFPTPLRTWLADARAGALFTALLEKDGLLAAYVNQEELSSLLGSHCRGEHDRTDCLWRLLNFQIWGDLFFTGRASRWSDGVFPASAAACRS